MAGPGVRRRNPVYCTKLYEATAVSSIPLPTDYRKLTHPSVLCCEEAGEKRQSMIQDDHALWHQDTG